MIDDYCEIMNRNGFVHLGKILDEEAINWFKKDLFSRMNDQDDIISKMFVNNDHYIKLIELPEINVFINKVLNDRAILQDIYGLTNLRCDDDITRNRFHRDMAWFPHKRTCVMIFIALEDVTDDNGPTEFVPFSHLIEAMPSDNYLNNHKIKMLLRSGEAFAIDATIWHRATKNNSKNPRPVLLLKYSLSFIKQPKILYNYDLTNLSEVVKTRLGFYASEKGWKSGNYTMENTTIQ